MDSETTIIGAGPYGLSIAAHLKAARRPYLLFGSPLESWRRYMPAGMILKSERFASNLWDPDRRYTLERYCALRNLSYQPVGSPLSLAQFLEYASWFQEHAVGEVQDVKVLRVERIPRGVFRLELANGDVLVSRRVILATGHMEFRVLPPELRGFSESLVSHSSRIGDVRNYAGREVTIVGAGQSALETAALLHEAGARVRVLVRRGRVEWNLPSKPRPLLQRILEPDAGVASGWKSWAVSELPRVFRAAFAPQKRHRFVSGSYGPSGSWWLRKRVEGEIDIQTDTQIRQISVDNGRLIVRVSRPSGVQELVTDHLISATGFKVDIDQIECIDVNLKREISRESGGIPSLDSKFQTSVTDLFVVGVASSPVFGPIMRFMYGAKHPARVLARHVGFR